LKHAASTLRDGYHALYDSPQPNVCQGCRSEIRTAEGLVADAGQFFEQVKPEKAVRAVANILRQMQEVTGEDRITVHTGLKSKGYVGGHFWPGRTDTVTYANDEIVAIFAAAIHCNYARIGDTVGRLEGTPIGGLSSKIAASAVLTLAEQTWIRDEYRVQVPDSIRQFPWPRIAVSCRYVDDTILISKMLCANCLGNLIPHIYPTTFDTACQGTQLEWLDMNIDTTDCTIRWQHRDPHLIPRWAMTRQFIRAYLIGRACRLDQLGLHRLDTLRAVSEIVQDLRTAGLTIPDCKWLWYSLQREDDTNALAHLREYLFRLYRLNT